MEKIKPVSCLGAVPRSVSSPRPTKRAEPHATHPGFLSASPARSLYRLVWWSGGRLPIYRNQKLLDHQLPSYHLACCHCSPQSPPSAPPPDMDPPPSSDIIIDTPFFRIYSDRRIDRLTGTDTVPAGFDSATGVTSKDVVIDGDTGVFVRLYLPADTATGSSPSDDKKLPVLVYFHGGGFVTQSAAGPLYHSFLNSLAARAAVLVVSVNYRLAPEHPLPAGYEDSFRALKWAVSGRGDPWLSRHGDLGRVFLAGDSAGGNIVHNVAMMAASEPEVRIIEGAVLLHPGFAGREPIEGETPDYAKIMEKLWVFACPEAADGVDDPRMNPMAAAAPSLRSLPCQRVLVCAAERDLVRPRIRAYYEALAASGWGGAVEWLESKGEGHVFFLVKPGCDEAVTLMNRLVAFFAGN